MIFILEYKIVFCFSSDITPLIKKIYAYSQSKGIVFQIKQVKSIKELLKIKDIFSYQTLIIQQYVNIHEPINVRLLTSLFSNMNIICIFDEKYRYRYNLELFNSKLYSCFFGDDLTHVSLQYFVKIILSGRSKENAKKYYNLKEDTNKLINYIDRINEIHNNTKDKDDMFVSKLEKLVVNLTENDIKIILTSVENDIVKRLIDIPIFYTHFKRISSNIKPYRCSYLNVCHKSYDNSQLIQVNKVNIGIVNMTRGSGATFFTMNFACALSRYLKISVMEYPLLDPYMYYYLGLNTVNNSYNTINDSPFYSDNNLNSIKNSSNMYYQHPTYNNISWMILDPNKNQNNKLNSLNMLKYLNVFNSNNINIVDLGCNIFDNLIMDILDQFSLIIVIIDPFVPNLLINLKYVDKIKELSNNKTVNLMYVVNKYNKGVDKHELIKFLGTRPIAYIPALEYRDIYKSVYDGVIPYDYKHAKLLLNKSFKKIYDECIKLGVINKTYKIKGKRWRVN